MKEYTALDDRLKDYLWSDIHMLYVAKVERNGRTEKELDKLIYWLTGIAPMVNGIFRLQGFTLKAFFEAAMMNQQSDWVVGLLFGIQAEEIEDPVIRRFLYLDKMVDELIKGKSLEQIMRVVPRND